MHVAMSRDALGVGILGKRAKAQAEGLVVAVRELLAAQVDHLVAEQGGADLLELRIGHVATHRRRQISAPIAAASGRASMCRLAAA